MFTRQNLSSLRRNARSRRLSRRSLDSLHRRLCLPRRIARHSAPNTPHRRSRRLCKPRSRRRRGKSRRAHGRARSRTGVRNRRLVLELKLSQLVVGSLLVWAFVLALVLALHSNQLKTSSDFRPRGRIAHKLEQIPVIAAEISPREDRLARIPQINSQPQILTEQKDSLVLVRRRNSSLLCVFLVKLCFSFLVGALDDKLVRELLGSAADESGRVLEDELAVAFDGERADDVQLALGQLDDVFLAGVAKEVFGQRLDRKHGFARKASGRAFGGGC